MSLSSNVHIIGAGVSGLSTASLLANENISCKVYEKSSTVVESVVKEPGLVWKNKMSHEVSQVKGLFFVGDSTVSYGIGTDSAAHSSILCHPKIISYLKNA